MSKLSQALFTTTQQKVLGLLYAHPNKSFYTKEILRKTGMGVATIKRELDRMLDANIITLTKIGNQHHYQANPHCPIYQELVSITLKTFGFADRIKNSLEPLSKNITWAFIFGSIASNKESANSDIDLMIIGAVKFSSVVSALHADQEILGREINPKIYSVQEWEKLQKAKNSFINEVISKPVINIIGSKDELR